MTPRQLFALRNRKISDMRWTELLFSRLTAAVCNFGFIRPKTPVADTAFMIHKFPEPKPEDLPGEVILRMLEALPKGAAERTQ